MVGGVVLVEIALVVGAWMMVFPAGMFEAMP